MPPLFVFDVVGNNLSQVLKFVQKKEVFKISYLVFNFGAKNNFYEYNMLEYFYIYFWI